MSEKLYVTRRGLANLHKELEKLEVALKHLESQVANVCDVGGNQWHDNASYDALVIDIRGADWRLSEAHRALKQTVLIDLPEVVATVVIGSKIKVIQDGHERTMEIVGYGESDPDLDLVMYKAPIAQILMGHKTGETVTGNIGGRQMQIKILEISKGGE